MHHKGTILIKIMLASKMSIRQLEEGTEREYINSVRRDLALEVLEEKIRDLEERSAYLEQVLREETKSVADFRGHLSELGRRDVSEITVEGIDALIEGLISRTGVRNPPITAEYIRNHFNLNHSNLNHALTRLFFRYDDDFDEKLKRLDSWNDVFGILTMPLELTKIFYCIYRARNLGVGIFSPESELNDMFVKCVKLVILKAARNLLLFTNNFGNGFKDKYRGWKNIFYMICPTSRHVGQNDLWPGVFFYIFTLRLPEDVFTKMCTEILVSYGLGQLNTMRAGMSDVDLAERGYTNVWLQKMFERLV